jgi:hypothetical protein
MFVSNVQFGGTLYGVYAEDTDVIRLLEDMNSFTPRISVLACLSLTAATTPTTAPSTAAVAWAVFTDAKHGIEVGYPPDWKVDKPVVVTDHSSDIPISDTPFSVHPSSSSTIRFWIESGHTNLQPEQIAQQADTYTLSAKDLKMDPVTEEKVEMDGVQAWRLSDVNPKPTKTEEVRIFTVKDGIATSIRIQGSPEEVKARSDELDRIVKSFHWISTKN